MRGLQQIRFRMLFRKISSFPNFHAPLPYREPLKGRSRDLLSVFATFIIIDAARPITALCAMHGTPIEKASSYGGFRMVLDVFGVVNGGPNDI